MTSKTSWRKLKMHTYNISHNGIIVFERVPEEEVEKHREAIKNFIWMGSSKKPEEIEEDIEVTLNSSTIA